MLSEKSASFLPEGEEVKQRAYNLIFDFFSFFGSCSKEFIVPNKITTTTSFFQDRTITVCENTFLQAGESVEIRKGTTFTVPNGSELEMAIGGCNVTDGD